MRLEKTYDAQGNKILVEKLESMNGVCDRCHVIMPCVIYTDYVISIMQFGCPRCGGNVRPLEYADWDDLTFRRIGERAIQREYRGIRRERRAKR